MSTVLYQIVGEQGEFVLPEGRPQVVSDTGLLELTVHTRKSHEAMVVAYRRIQGEKGTQSMVDWASIFQEGEKSEPLEVGGKQVLIEHRSIAVERG